MFTLDDLCKSCEEFNLRTQNIGPKRSSLFVSVNSSYHRKLQYLEALIIPKASSNIRF